MFVCSGSEADENAVKIARSYTGRPNIIVFTGAFHGRTSLTMTMTAKKAYAVGMGPFPDGVYRAEFPNLYRAPGHMTEEEAIAVLRRRSSKRYSSKLLHMMHAQLSYSNLYRAKADSFRLLSNGLRLLERSVTTTVS